ncbi:autotransporter assembly complex protein TamA [Phytohalomonas tamaricis]|uniref:autotransporter assembly complex protein TamA n=1 Tax=Phytohalomonas tamaricis TaxID=2081032 RepID=UPI000D0BB950|nr:autotransporter assembly complex family protein [Phytohalomonas tamaricis]
MRKSLLGATSLAAIIGLCTATQNAFAVDANVDGIDGAPETNIEAYLASLTIPEGAELASYEPEALKRTQNALKVYGYYEPEIYISFPDHEHVNITVKPGEQVKINNLVVRIRGAARDDKFFQQALDESALMKSQGEPLNHADYDALKQQLSTIALERGYFDARYLTHRLEIRPWANAANVVLIFDSGKRYRFGEVSFEGSQIKEERLRNMLPFEPGDYYSASELSTYNQRLSSTGWFRSAAVRPQIASSDEVITPSPDENSSETAAPEPIDTTVPITVELIPADRHRFETGIGYATDVGTRVQFGWTMPWINERGDSLTNSIFYSGPEKRASGQYTIPLDNPLRDSYQIRYNLEDIDNEDTDSFESSLTFAREWNFTHGWTQSVYLRAQREDFTQADQDDIVFLLVPGASWSHVNVDNIRFPMRGDREDLLVEFSDTAWGSDARFVRTRLQSQLIGSIGDSNRFFTRTTVGATATDTFDKVPPSLRFFAGGDNSIRGYDYESLSPENEDGDLLGGKHLFTATAEYQRRIKDGWWLATFADGGNSFDDWWPDDIKTSAGLGVRWISPVGPISLDIAHPFDDEENSWRLHFAIGPEF